MRLPRVATAPIAAVLLALVTSAAAPAAGAGQHLMHMGHRINGERFRFEPQVLLIAPGDQVRFEPDGDHYASKSIAGMGPEAGPRWRSRIGLASTVTFDVPGVYGVKCPGHYEMGMVGLIVVGTAPANWTKARAIRHPPAAAEVIEGLFDEAACRLGPSFADQCPRTALKDAE